MCAGVRKGEINLGDWIEVEDENSSMTVIRFGDALNVLTRRAQASPLSR